MNKIKEIFNQFTTDINKVLPVILAIYFTSYIISIFNSQWQELNWPLFHIAIILLFIFSLLSNNFINNFLYLNDKYKFINLKNIIVFITFIIGVSLQLYLIYLILLIYTIIFIVYKKNNQINFLITFILLIIIMFLYLVKQEKTADILAIYALIFLIITTLIESLKLLKINK